MLAKSVSFILWPSFLFDVWTTMLFLFLLPFFFKSQYIRHLQMCKWKHLPQNHRQILFTLCCDLIHLDSCFLSHSVHSFIQCLLLARFRLADLRWLCSTELFTVFYLSFEFFVHSSPSCITSVFNLILFSWFVVVRLFVCVLVFGQSSLFGWDIFTN